MAQVTMKRKREDEERVQYDVLIHEDGRRQYTRKDGWFWTEYADGTFHLKSLPPGKYFFGDAYACDEIIDDLSNDKSICAVRVNTDGSRSVCVVLNLYTTRTFQVRQNNELVTIRTDKLVFVSEDICNEPCMNFESPVHVYMNEDIGVLGIKSGDTTISFPV